MKKIVFVLVLAALVLSACAPKQAAASGESLKVKSDTAEKTYSVESLKALGNAQAADKGVTYVGVPLKTLLQNAGIDTTKISAVKAVASDGFTANYDASTFNADNSLVAYARADGPLSKDEGTFRMVIPDQGGKMNPRMVVELDVVP